MEIHYRTNKLKKVLENDRLINKHYSNINKALKARLTELLSVSSLSQISHLPPPRRHKLSGNYKNCWAVDVSRNQRLIFSAFYENTMDISDIKEIVIEEIEDYH